MAASECGNHSEHAKQPSKRRSKPFFSLDIHKKKKKLEDVFEQQLAELPELHDMPLYHSTPVKCNDVRKDINSEKLHATSAENVSGIEITSEFNPEDSLICISCQIKIRKPDVLQACGHNTIYGILCSKCGTVNTMEYGSRSSCHHSILVAYEMCDICGSVKESNSIRDITHTHSHLSGGEMCEKCGCGVSNFTFTHGENIQSHSDDMSHTHSHLSGSEICDKCGFGVAKCNFSYCKDVQLHDVNHRFKDTDKETVITSLPVGNTGGEDEVVHLTQDNKRTDVDCVDYSNPGFCKEKSTESCNDSNDSVYDLMKSCLNVLDEMNGDNLLLELLSAIRNGSLKPESLTYHIFLDTMKALNSSSLTRMRYNFTSKVFWKTFINKFGAAPLRFLSGWKHAGSILLNRGEKGSFPGEEADIILAIPDEDILKSFHPYNGEWPRSIPPGICTNIINKLAVAHEDTSICISLDGKKVVPGLKGDKGDINLLGKESEVGCLPPAVQKQLHQQEVQSVENIKKLSADTEPTTDQVNTNMILENLRALLTMLSKKKADTRDTLEKKTYALEKLKARAAVDQTSTKFQYPISLVTANILELKESSAIGDRLRDCIAEMCAALFSDQNTWTTMTTISIDHCGRYHALHDIDLFLGCGEESIEKFAKYVIDQGLPFIKQRSSLWFQARKQVRVTASTLYNAVGCAGLKSQREHYQQAVLGFERPPPDTSVQEAMDWGTKHEVCSLATVASKVLPAFFPECCLLEVGAFPIQVGNVDMIISPDGFIHNNLNHTDIAAVECKCPRSGIVPNSIPPRYYLQVQAHMRCKPGIQWCLFCVWTEQTTKVFRVEKDDEIWSLVQQELNDIFGDHVTRCPTKLSVTAKEIRKIIRTNSHKYCSIIAELSSLHACCFDTDNAVTISEANPNPYTTDVMHCNFVTCSTPKMKDLPLIKLDDTLDEVVCYLRKHYLLSRKKATEVIAFVACNTDRLWSSALTHGTPICYFLKGYSLPTSVVRSILEDVLNYCHSKGIHCPVQSFDGQYLPLLQTSNNGTPLTMLELQKVFWKEVCSKTKNEIVSEMKNINHITDINDVSEKIGGVITVTQCDKLPLTAFACLKLTQIHNDQPPAHVPEEGTSTSTDVQQIIEEIPECVISLGETNDLETGSKTNQKEEHEQQESESDQSSTQEEAAVQEDVEGDVDNYVFTPDIQSAENLPSPQSRVSDTENSSLLGETDINNILALLKDQTMKWNSKGVDDLKQQMENCQNLCKMTIPELKVILKYLKDHKHQSVIMTGRKQCLVGSLKYVLHLPGDINTPTCSKSPPNLSLLCVKILSSKMYPKQALCVSYANWKFPEKVKKWKSESRIKHNMVITEIDGKKPINWFYIPEYSTDREELLVRKIDPHHLLTRHRSALCKRNIGDAERKHFLEVAADNTTSLKLGMLEESLDMQCTDFALITFSEEVQTQLERKGYNVSAKWCKLIREWFNSMDEPGIPAVERFKMKMRYREILLSMVDMYSFPPPGMFVKGYPKALWESTIASIDAELILCGLVKRRTYNQRAVSSQLCESLFGSLASLSSSRHGVPNCVDLETNFAKLCGEMVVRYDPHRGFPVRLSSASIYPEQELEIASCPSTQPMDPPTYISDIKLKDHPFDKPERQRTARRRLKGITNPHEPGKGVTGVRGFHKVNEGKLNGLVRLGKSTKTNL